MLSLANEYYNFPCSEKPHFIRVHKKQNRKIIGYTPQGFFCKRLRRQGTGKQRILNRITDKYTLFKVRYIIFSVNT
jgi:hypothetical protein